MYAKSSFPLGWFRCSDLDPGTFPLLLLPGPGMGFLCFTWPWNPFCTWPNGLRPATCAGNGGRGPGAVS